MSSYGFWEPTRVFFATIFFNIANPTSYRLDLFSVKVVIDFGNQSGEFEIIKSNNSPGLIPPSGNVEIGGIEIVIPCSKRNEVGEVIFPEYGGRMNVFVRFRDAMGRMETQHCAIICNFVSERKTDFKPLSNIMVKSEEQASDQSQK